MGTHQPGARRARYMMECCIGSAKRVSERKHKASYDRISTSPQEAATAIRRACGRAGKNSAIGATDWQHPASATGSPCSGNSV